MKSNSNQLWSNIKTVLFYILSGLLVLYILFELFLPNMTVKVFQFKPYNVITESMTPILNVDDMIVVRSPNVDDLKVGDIITFKADINYDQEKEIVTHYVHSIDELNGKRIFKTARHNEATNEPSIFPDTWVLYDDDVLGVYWFKIPKLGMLVNFFRSPFGIATVAVNLIIIGIIVYLIKTDKKEKINQPVN